MVSGLLLRGLIAGVLAGFLAAGFSFFFGEPPLERALAFEASATEPSASAPELVSRKTQRGAGLFAAHIIYGAAMGGLFSLAFALSFGRSNDLDPRALSGLLAIAGFVALVLAPELKYPANPPGTGETAAIGARTALYFGMLVITLLAMIIAGMLAPFLMARLDPWNGVLACAAVFVLITAFAAAALPAAEEVRAGFPASVLWDFRMASLGARGVFWAALGLIFGVMAEHWLNRMAHLRKA
jgi:predicted cobalt transporter CbtA